MSTINFPNTRLETSGVGNPLFVTDVVNANESLLTAMKSLCGLADNGFAIISGLAYGSGAYGAGIVYMMGNFYYTAGLAENKYLTPANQNVFPKVFQDANTRDTYLEYRAIQSNTQWSGMPQFAGNMNEHRLNLKRLEALITEKVDAEAELRYQNDANITDSIIALNNSLGDAAFKDTGTTAGTVAAGNDARFTDAREIKTINGTTLHSLYFDFTGWDMDTTDQIIINVASANINASKIKLIYASVANASTSLPQPLINNAPTGAGGGITGSSVNGSGILQSVTISRATGGMYDNSFYNNVNGYLLVQYSD